MLIIIEYTKPMFSQVQAAQTAASHGHISIYMYV